MSCKFCDGKKNLHDFSFATRSNQLLKLINEDEISRNKNFSRLFTIFMRKRKNVETLLGSMGLIVHDVTVNNDGCDYIEIKV